MEKRDLYLSDIMSKKLHTLKPDDSVLDNVDIFNELKLHHLPVVIGENEPIGMVSKRDFDNYRNILRVIDNDGKSVKIREIMTEPIFSFFEDVPITQAAQAMIDNHINAIVVINRNEKMVGIVTSTDLLRFVAKS